jgi:hypothetical protein
MNRQELDQAFLDLDRICSHRLRWVVGGEEIDCLHLQRLTDSILFFRWILEEYVEG